SDDTINANVFLLTPDKPNLLPVPADGLVQERSEAASKSLLDDLRSDKGMGWVPAQMWFTYLRVGEQTGRLRYDLAIDKTGDGAPSPVMAGLEAPPAPTTTTSPAPPTTAKPTSTTAKPKPKPPVTPTTSGPALPTTTPTLDPSLSVIVEPPTAPAEAAAAAETTTPLAAALPAGHDGGSGGTSAAVLIAAVGGGALASGLAAWTLQTRLRRRATQP
ncbi:MAG TPA: hypothetical protein VGR20_08970, partial [Acidimicrobiia bacterium]|nr:hypothetical protein [Acidimicrobiia bacterium]